MSGPTKFEPVIIRASAGTGKTYQLAVRFIGLLAHGARPDEILATTFTRKAAGEILDRVLLWLAQAADSESKRKELAAVVGDDSLTRTRCRQLLVATVRSLHRLRVGTLDSFFIQVAGSFALELGLPPGWSICEPIDDSAIRDEAIELVLARGRLADLLTLVHSLAKGDTARGVSQLVRDTTGGLFEMYRDAAQVAWQQLPRHKELPPEELERTIDAIASFDLSANKQMAKARDGDVELARAADWEGLIDKGLTAKVLSGECVYYKKPIPVELVALYRILLKQAEAVLVGQVARQTEATYDLLTRFAEHYRALQHDERMLRFSDVTQRLSQATMVAGPEQLAFRLDAGLKHVLLDEFQDTAPAQWRVLRPLAQAVTTRPGGSFFCVGDAKQAIYGWRGGVAEIFDALEGELTCLTRQSLSQSFRSAPPVIEAVNQVFQNLTNHPDLDNLAEPIAAWQNRFPEHTTSKTKLAGYVRFEMSPAPTEEQNANEVHFEYAAAEVARAAKANPQRSIGVLVRKNEAVAHLIYLLRDRHQLLASEEGGNPLTDSPAVELILSLLKLADHPGDSVARFHLATSPLAAALELNSHNDTAAAVRIGQQLRRQLLEEGYGATIQHWAQRLAESCDRRDLSRLQQLVEMAYNYQCVSTLRADRFISLVQSERVTDPTAADVRVMTIHQSKGLQFDVVFLPQLDCKLIGQPDSFVAGRSRPTEPVNIVCRLASGKVRQFFPPPVAKLFDEEANRKVSESLCVLYVAMTRAVHALHLIAEPPAANERKLSKSAAGLLRATLAPDKAAAGGTVLYEHGDPAWAKKSPQSVREAAVSPPLPLGERRGEGELSADQQAPIKLAPPLLQRDRGLERTSPSALEGGPRIRAELLLEPKNAAAFEYGTLVHAWAEQVGWFEEGLPDDAALTQVVVKLAAKLGHVASDVRPYLAEFRRQIAAPAIAAALSRSAYAGFDELEVQRERRFAVRLDDKIVSGSIDRLVIARRGGRVVAADVLDFKTDDIAAPGGATKRKAATGAKNALDDKVKFYEPQLQGYRQAVAQMLGLTLQQVSAHLIFLKPGTVVSVG